MSQYSPMSPDRHCPRPQSVPLPTADPQPRPPGGGRSPCPVTPPLVGSPPRRVVRVEMRNALFSGILIHLIGFHFRVFQRPSIQAGFRHCLILMSKFEQISSAATQLPSELRGGHTLGESSDDQD